MCAPLDAAQNLVGKSEGRILAASCQKLYQSHPLLRMTTLMKTTTTMKMPQNMIFLRCVL